MHKQTVLRWKTYQLHSVHRTSNRTPFRVNWYLCASCPGENKNDKLVSPVNFTRRDSGSGYITLADNLPKFADVGQLPIQVPLSHLGGVYMRKLAPARVSYRHDFLISYRVYMMTGLFHI